MNVEPQATSAGQTDVDPANSDGGVKHHQFFRLNRPAAWPITAFETCSARCGTGLAQTNGVRFVDASVQLLGVGSVAFGIWGLIDPESLTGLMGDHPDVGRALGARDTLVGVALLGVPGPFPLAMRVASDLHDAIRLRQRSPKVALGAVTIALWGAATFVCSMSASTTRSI